MKLNYIIMFIYFIVESVLTELIIVITHCYSSQNYSNYYHYHFYESFQYQIKWNCIRLNQYSRKLYLKTRKLFDLVSEFSNAAGNKKTLTLFKNWNFNISMKNSKINST